MTTRVALLGFPVGHSRSPAMHNEAFRERRLDWRYEAIEVEPERFESLARELPGRGFAGANVTIPHKLKALSVADSASTVARAVGAANTLRFGDGHISADNTDVDGFLRALHERAPGAPAGMNALVIGAGGAGRAVVYALLDQGAAGVAVWNRHPERAEKLVQDLQAFAPGVPLRAISDPAGVGAELLVNATSIGMPSAGGAATEAEDFKLLRTSADNWRDVRVVVELVYRHGGTRVVREAESRGLTYVDGIDILVHQGAASFELWTGVEAPLEVMRLGARKRQGESDT